MPSAKGYKACEICGSDFPLRTKRDHSRKRFCSHRCKGLWLSSLPKTDRLCRTCSSIFTPKNNCQLFCSKECVPKYCQTTEQQYSRIVDPKSYFKTLLCRKDRRSLSMEDVLDVLEKQSGKCALTGITLTFKRELGIKLKTNASIDRIIPGGPYVKENIRLVCSIVNKMRLDMLDDELLYWCQKILTPEEA